MKAFINTIINWLFKNSWITPLLGFAVPIVFMETYNSAFFALFVLGTVGTGFAYVVYGTLMVRAGAVRGVIGVFFTPIVATILGLVFLDESVSIIAVVGMCIVICGAYLTSRPEKVTA